MIVMDNRPIAGIAKIPSVRKRNTPNHKRMLALYPNGIANKT